MYANGTQLYHSAHLVKLIIIFYSSQTCYEESTSSTQVIAVTLYYIYALKPVKIIYKANPF